MSDEYFILKYPADNPRGYCTLDELEGIDNFDVMRQGASLTSKVPDQLSMSMYVEEPRNTVLPDYVQNMQRLVIVSPRLRAFLEAQEISHVEHYPLEIIDHKGKVASDEYSVIHLIGPVDCIDGDASQAKWNNVGLATQRIRRLKKLVIDPINVPDGRKLFFPKFFRKYPIIHRDLAETMGKEGFTNIKIVPLGE